MELELGTQHVLVNRNAKEPADILLPTGVYDPLIRRLTKAIYKRSGCYHIHAPLLGLETVNALQLMREEILQKAQTDLDTLKFLDQLYWLFQAIFMDLPAGEAEKSAPAQAASGLLLFR